MSDETKLADVIAAHRPQMGQTLAPGSLVCQTPTGATCGRFDDTAAWAAHVVEVISKTPGIVVVELPEPDVTVAATDDEHGVKQWWIPAGVVAAFDSGTVEVAVAHYHGDDLGRVRDSAAALLAAVVVGLPTEQPAHE